MLPMTEYLVPCTADEWSDYLSDLRTYATETDTDNFGVMFAKLSPHGGYAEPGKIVGEVHYPTDGSPKRYYIYPPGTAIPMKGEVA